MSKPDYERLFLALWPDEAATKAIAQVANGFNQTHRCRTIPTENFHVTLVFLGGVQVGLVESLCAHLQNHKFSAFKLYLDRQLVRKSQKMCWLTGESPPELSSLVKQLRELVREFNIFVEDRSFTLHLTIARKIGNHNLKPSVIEPISWHCREFVLARSETLSGGAQYEIIKRFPLV